MSICSIYCYTSAKFQLFLIIIFVLNNEQILGYVVDKYFETIQPSASPEIQKEAAWNVINRIIPEYSHRFKVEINPKFSLNSYQIIKYENESYVRIQGSSGVAICKGFYHYLKYYLKGHVSWSGYQISKITNEFPSVIIKHVSPSRFVYYQNVCTWSYSFVWWTFKEWRHHIDWMALMGINLSIAPIQEAIWTKIYRRINLFENEINEHFTGPAFSAWQRMGNIRGWGGPISTDFKNKQFNLQREIIKAQRDLGMIIAVPGFAGHVPKAFERIFSNTSFTPVSRWNHFENRYCCPLFIDPSDPVFTLISDMFLKEIIHNYGTDHIYFADPFNELVPKQHDAQYLSNSSSNIYQAMYNVDHKAVWLMQGWMFVKNPFWSEDSIKAFLTAVPLGKLLVLDLQSEQYPQYDRTNSYFGQPFIWNMLHNFGGTLGMHGSVNIVNRRIEEARKMAHITMVGVGVTPEGINQNYPIYEFALERAWNYGEFNVTEWFNYYSVVRYGINDYHLKNTWNLLLKSVYDYKGLIKLHGKYTICRRPSIKISPWLWYDPMIVRIALKSMLESDMSVHNSSLFQYDLVDLTRQFLQISGDKIYLNVMSGYKRKNLTILNLWSNAMIELLQDLEEILETNRNFMLGVWLKAARNMGDDWREKASFEYNARNQITIWGPNAEIVDYANKQWSGLTKDFFIPRWKLFLFELQKCLLTNTTFKEKLFMKKVFENVENSFTTAKKIYPDHPAGNTVSVSYKIYTKWSTFWDTIENSKKIPIIQF